MYANKEASGLIPIDLNEIWYVNKPTSKTIVTAIATAHSQPVMNKIVAKFYLIAPSCVRHRSSRMFHSTSDMAQR